MTRQLQGVGRDAGLQGRQHLGGRAEEAIGRDQTVDALMGPLKVVMVDEVADAALGIAEVQEDGALDALPP